MLPLPTYDADGDRTQLAASIGGTNDFVNNYAYIGIDDQMSQVTQSGNGGDAVAAKSAAFTYLCPGQVGGADFVRPLGEPGSKGVGRFSFSHKSMAA